MCISGFWPFLHIPKSTSRSPTLIFVSFLFYFYNWFILPKMFPVSSTFLLQLYMLKLTLLRPVKSWYHVSRQTLLENWWGFFLFTIFYILKKQRWVCMWCKNADFVWKWDWSLHLAGELFGKTRIFSCDWCTRKQHVDKANDPNFCQVFLFNMGLINKGWNSMIVACGIWYLADVSSVSPLSAPTFEFQLTSFVYILSL